MLESKPTKLRVKFVHIIFFEFLMHIIGSSEESVAYCPVHNDMSASHGVAAA